MAFDLLIKNGTVVDGSGLPRYRADIGVKAAASSRSAASAPPAERVIDADGLIVAPGFIDGHTHMDAQVAWDPIGSCSCWHGVTSVVMGNCGFALAPCKPADREWFARCLTAVEDIPTEAMLAGIEWNWETFPEYLAMSSDCRRRSITACISAIRRCACTRWASAASTRRRPRTICARWRTPSPGDPSRRARLLDLARYDAYPPGRRPRRQPHRRLGGDRPAGRRDGGELDSGIFQIGPTFPAAKRSGSFSTGCARWRSTPAARSCSDLGDRQGATRTRGTTRLRWIDETVAQGGRIWGQATTRSINAIFSLRSYLPFDYLPVWRDPRAAARRAEGRLRDPEMRAVSSPRKPR